MGHMLFNSIELVFLFLPLCFVGYWLLPKRYRSVWIVAASVIFYATAGVGPVFRLIALLTVTYLNARSLLNKQSHGLRRLGLVIALLNLAPLLLFKYLFSTLSLALPLGIS